jgi:hypothetical protein
LELDFLEVNPWVIYYLQWLLVSVFFTSCIVLYLKYPTIVWCAKTTNIQNNSKAVSRTVFIASVIAILIISAVVVSFEYNQVNSLQSSINKLQTDQDELQTSYNQLQATYNQLQTTYNQLLSSRSSSNQAEITNLQNQIASLQSQLSDATTLVSKLRGPTGILPTYSSLAYVGPVSSGGSYFLQLSLKNTGTVPIKEIFVTINSVPITMTFTYLDTIISTSAPLPSYQTATGRQNVTPPVNNAGTYSLIIQAIATNGTIYTYQTTISS